MRQLAYRREIEGEKKHKRSTNLVADKVAQTIANALRIKPIIPFIFRIIAKAARNTTGSKQYPKTEQVRQKSRSMG
jgi:hypothetical protein